MNIVLDTNILISAIIKEGATRNLIINSEQNFLLPEFEFLEIKNHKQEIIEKSGLSDQEFEDILLNLLKYIKIIWTEEIVNYREQAANIMGNIDKDDTIFIATAFAYDAVIWSDDKHFQQQNIVKILTTKDMFNLFKD